MTFDEAFAQVLDHEGGYVNDPDDPGGETNYGISKRSYPDEDIAGMTLKRAGELYRRDYWDPCRCDELPHPVDFIVFDAAVNSGIRRSVKWLQHIVGTNPDGVMGPITLAAAQEADPWATAARASALRLKFLANLEGFTKFGRGWTRRVADNLLQVNEL